MLPSGKPLENLALKPEDLVKQGRGRKGRNVCDLPAGDIAGPGLQLTHVECSGGEQAQSMLPGCPPTLPCCAPRPAHGHHWPCLPVQAYSTGLLSPWDLISRRQGVQQQPRSPRASCSLTKEGPCVRREI